MSALLDNSQIDLRARVHLGVTAVDNHGMATIVPRSVHRTQIDNRGRCARLCGRFTVHPTRGVIGVTVLAGGRRCWGGLLVAPSGLVAALRCPLEGQIVIMFTATKCGDQ